MKRTLLILLASTLIPAAACDSEPSTPGTLNVRWTLGPVSSCDDLHLEDLQARALLGDEVIAQVNGSCPADAGDGTLTIAEIMPGNYRIEVEGFDGDGNGTYLGESESSAGVPDGGEAETDPIRLWEKKAHLIVDWDVGGKCSTSDTDKVQVTLFDEGGVELEIDNFQEKADCDATFPHPVTGEETAGILFEDLTSIDNVIVLAEGLGADGNKVREGTVEGVDLPPGEIVSIVVVLE